VNEASGGGQRRAVCSLSSGTGADERRLQEEAVGSSGRQALQSAVKPDGTQSTKKVKRGEVEQRSGREGSGV
jgi:hypothetical protein